MTNPRISYPLTPRVHPVVQRWAEPPLFEKREKPDFHAASYARVKELLKDAQRRSRASKR